MKKTLTILATLALVAAISIGGTLAYLTAKTDAVTNTFTVGNIGMTLDEHTRNADGTLTDQTTNAINDYKVIPGATDHKDPTLHVAAGSEPCYVYALVDNGLVIGGTTVADVNVDGEDWVTVETSGTKTLYRYNNIVDASTTGQDLEVFSTVTYSDTITSTTIEGLAGKSIIIQGYAHQSANTTSDAADAAAKVQFSL